MQCPQCQHENPPQAKFCLECGARFKLMCAACSTELPAGAKFCLECGQPIETKPPALSRFTPPAAYTPKHLAEKILTSRAALEGERKQVTVLFVDLKGSTELIADLDPEEAQTLLDPALHIMMEAVHRYEGTVNQVLGDGIMALFGAPLAHEDHAVRACYAALAMQAGIRRYADEVRRTHGVEIQIRVGLNSGEVVVRTVGNDLHMDYSAVGQTTHLAARMEQTASPGTIQITPTVQRLVEGYVQVKALSPMPIKGLRDSLEVFAVLGAGPVQTRLQAAAMRGLSPMVGRQTEVALLSQALAQAWEGHGQVVGVIGEPGVGKSRLVWEVLQSFHLDGWRVFASRGLAYSTTTPYLPIIELLKGYFDIETSDDVHQRRAKITNTLLRLDRALAPSLPAILALLDVPVDELRWQALEPPQRRQHILDAWKYILLRESQIQPLLVIVEDLQWIDTETQACLDILVESLPAARLLLLVNYRPEYQHTWGSKTAYSQIRLDPLPAASAEALFQALVGANPALEPLQRLLIARTGGNPFFLEESVQTLVETDVLVGEPGAYHLAQALPTIQVPATVQAVMAARLDRLPPEEKRLLQVAAVIGMEVPFLLLQSVAALSEEALRRSLTHLQTTEFLYEARLFPELEYTFKHALLHDVAYMSLLERQRRVYHAAVGHSLEILYAGRTDEVVELLAYHFGRSTEDEDAVDYAILAADKAQQRWANTETLAHLEVARQRLETMPDTASNRLRRIDTVLKQGEVKFALGRHVEHIESLNGIRTLVDEIADPRRRATWYYWMGFLHSLTGSRPEVAIAYCREAAAIADTGGFDDIRAFAEACLTQVHVVAGNLWEAVATGERALATFEASGNVWWACRTLWHLTTTANALGEWMRSLEYCRRALEHGLAVDDLRLKVVGWWRTGSTHLQRGDPALGLQCCEEALALSPTPFDVAMIKGVRGRALVQVGQVEAGMAELTAIVAWLEQSRLYYTHAVLVLWLGEVHLHQGEWCQARVLFEEVLATSQEAGYRHLAGVAERCLGESLMAEDVTAAAGHLDAAVHILEAVGARNEVAKALVAQAKLHRTAGDVSGARCLLERALTLFETLGTLDEPHRVQALLAML
jgi:class 3 adenylate cyclase/tetratricopeptide (TPR) repeat protein